ncbi:hypothetical protein A3F34_01130 [Candidatus Roizmanbacteria bacterium RIFCSPHIGHO2_12_FULL_44_10]|uniref:Uncharacterized protein n=1 Tax=Candidatus Roizmanbacteria bacterium RIFCSPHIGHO2_12_FULL_44_10 TaxID=1802054 RepID=A0A1F7I6W7_9BACT|nr:MAG: hypothetical protein A3F34_01130 [Candidatus Roizmanbacteria bacterium RIFCSPHIGHO2_12_FULL_44_10]
MVKKRSLTHKVEADVRHHLIEYLLLLSSGVIFLVFLSIFRGEHTRQFIVLTVFIAYYIIWGIIHHSRDQSLHLKIVLEYIIIGALAFVLLRSLLMA